MSKSRIHRLARQHADQRAHETLEYLRGDDQTKAKIVDRWLTEEISKPRAHATIVGLETIEAPTYVEWMNRQRLGAESPNADQE